jgi:Bromodomain
MSLKKIQKLVKGSEFKFWAAFEEETSTIWKNAWHYNEDGSDISNLAKDLEVRKYPPFSGRSGS